MKFWNWRLTTFLAQHIFLLQNHPTLLYSVFGICIYIKNTNILNIYCGYNGVKLPIPEVLEAAARCEVVGLRGLELSDQDPPLLGANGGEGNGEGDGGGVGHGQVDVLPGEGAAEVGGQDLGEKRNYKN